MPTDDERATALWNRILETSGKWTEIESAWTANLRALYPDIKVVDLASRFLGPWQRLLRNRIAIASLAEVLGFPISDFPGWQALCAAITRVHSDLSEEDSGILAFRLSRALTEAMKVTKPPGSTALRLVSSFANDEGTESAIPERWTQAGDLVGSSDTIREIIQKCSWAANDRYPVLISGETGAGKEVVARRIHQLCTTRGRFVPINCAALPEALIEEELFGHARGAFTGASTQRDGLFAEANEGTLLLDEIFEIPLPQQAKVLRVLQDGMVRRIGSTRFDPVNVRVIGTTNRPIEEALRTNQMRRDLYYRLSVHQIHVPPLREHAEDIPELVAAFLARWGRANPELAPPSISQEAVELLCRGRWPGNIRQLEHTVYRLATRHAGETIGNNQLEKALDHAEGRHDESREATGTGPRLSDAERAAVAHALAVTDGNKAAAARLLGVTRKTLYHKIRQFGIDRS